MKLGIHFLKLKIKKTPENTKTKKPKKTMFLYRDLFS